MTKYNHALTIAFEVITEDEYCEDMTYEDMKAGLLKRIEDLNPANNPWGNLTEYKEATLKPFDTYIIDEEEA